MKKIIFGVLLWGLCEGGECMVCPFLRNNSPKKLFVTNVLGKPIEVRGRNKAGTGDNSTSAFECLIKNGLQGEYQSLPVILKNSDGLVCISETAKSEAYFSLEIQIENQKFTINHCMSSEDIFCVFQKMAGCFGFLHPHTVQREYDKKKNEEEWQSFLKAVGVTVIK